MDNRVICVVGPTATGKTKMGVALAKRFGGEVVSVDSMQIYRGMTIGTAAPTAEEMDGVRHHMVAIADPAESWSVARFTEQADLCIGDILRRGGRPVLVGGTGLYLDSILSGRTFAPGHSGGEIRKSLQAEMAREGIESLYRQLREIDPETAARLPIRDEKRILRALEVYRETGETLTAHDARTRLRPPKYRACTIGLTFRDRADLYARIDRRVDTMVECGLLREVEALLQTGLPETATALQAIGYKQFLSVYRGDTLVSEAVAEVKLRSRQYAKRQLTWLRRKDDIHWLLWEKDPDFPAGLQNATEYLLAQGLG
ncbi:tRNA dimethylallyltransferase (plasmid) [Vescimonas fastidiosa]|uniref:tRNA dimethylallyltransferase n=1 Tax=Vescimonas fastidiosa TaxID=2714353 RepID=A0A810PUS6_9FIRM|nr:tRNA (adenosine(37)-N6)-dimethylallyltransferase MiaA [Vescimonas fastidiosa]BCK79510.1 tRNA dimethylallyltransferase [Vescimonas fastidiosa]